MENASDGTPQFATAEYAPNPAPTDTTCAACRRAIDGDYYQINGHLACPACAHNARSASDRDTHKAFVRAVVFGVGGAIAGFLLYVAFALSTGLILGWIALAVGYIVGKAMHFGSGGIGGRRYQIVAVALTYLAVSMASVPMAINQLRAEKTQASAAAAASDTPAPSQPGLIKVIGSLALFGVASPFLELADPLHGIIGLVILFVGLRFAWRFTAGTALQVTGPFAPSPAGAI